MPSANPQNGDAGVGRNQHLGEFGRLFRACGLSQGDLARLTDTHVNTVSRWNTGKSVPPGAVLAFLRLYRDVQSILGRA